MPRAPISILADAEPVVQVTAKRASNMLEKFPHNERQASGTPPRHHTVCDKWLVGWVLLTLVRSGEALGGEQAVLPGDALEPDFNVPPQRTPVAASMVSIPIPYQAPDPSESKTFSTRDFRPRAPSIFEKDSRADPFDDAPMIHSPTVWQRLAEYRAHDRVRLVTLWETGGGSISLQAGRKGEPSLQWTSRLMNRGGATHGLLDKFLAASLAGASRGLHFAPRTAAPEPMGKPAKLMEVRGGVLK